MALIQYDHCPHEKGKSGCRDTHIETAPHEDERGDDGDASISQETPKIVSKASEVRREAWKVSLSQPSCVHACEVASVTSDSATPRTVACQAPLSTGFSRQEHWSGLPFLSSLKHLESSNEQMDRIQKSLNSPSAGPGFLDCTWAHVN